MIHVTRADHLNTTLFNMHVKVCLLPGSFTAVAIAQCSNLDRPGYRYFLAVNNPPVSTQWKRKSNWNALIVGYCLLVWTLMLFLVD